MNDKQVSSRHPPILLVGYADDPLKHLILQLLEHAQIQTSPLDLSQNTIVFPLAGNTPRFHELLLAQAVRLGHRGLIPPASLSFTAWLESHAAPGNTLTRSQAELLLLDALQEHPDLIDRYGAWPLVDSLLTLFEELAVSHMDIPDSALAFEQQLQHAYGQKEVLEPLSLEAHLVHTLWQAWQSQCRAHGVRDIGQCQSDGLQALVGDETPNTSHTFIIGKLDFSHYDTGWLRTLLKQGHTTLILQGRRGETGYHPDHLITALVDRLDLDASQTRISGHIEQTLDQAFTLTGPPILERAHQLGASGESPLSNCLSVLPAQDAEQEARAIALQSRLWLHQGHRHIGIICNDRRLARRVRALLECAGITLHDPSGWSLSTTSVATLVDRFLQCMEQDFSHRPLLDLLHSPFIRPEGLSQDELIQLLPLLENTIVIERHCTQNLSRYQTEIAALQNTLLDKGKGPAQLDIDLEKLQRLFGLLEKSKKPLARLLQGHFKLSRYLKGLLDGLQALGALPSYREDAAGQQLLDFLQDFLTSHQAYDPKLNWQGFRTWLHRMLGRLQYRPESGTTIVTLLGIQESRLYHFDALVIAAATREYYPGHRHSSPFFNDAVRTQLGLPSLQQSRIERYYDFRRLLQAGKDVLISYSTDEQQDVAAVSPWLERLLTLHKLAFQDDLVNGNLLALCTFPAAPGHGDNVIAPTKGPAQAILPAGRVPNRLSASSCQTLVDCPYQFFARYGLHLGARDAIHEELEKNDYGRRVHVILKAFHFGVPGLAAAWPHPITQSQRDTAIARLNDISKTVFADDIENDYLARAWLQRWQQYIPGYIDWCMARDPQWTPFQGEITLSQNLATRQGFEFEIHGRLDRLDTGAKGLSIIDYKTGGSAKENEVLAGEAVQLPFYAMLTDKHVDSACLLQIDGVKPRETAHIKGKALEDLRRQTASRLDQNLDSMLAGQPLVANGIQTTCNYCDTEGLCRKGHWPDS